MPEKDASMVTIQKLVEGMGPKLQTPGVHPLETPIPLGKGKASLQLYGVVVPDKAEGGTQAPALLLQSPKGLMMVTVGENGSPTVKVMKQSSDVLRVTAQSPEATLAALMEALFEEAPADLREQVLASLPQDMVKSPVRSSVSTVKSSVGGKTVPMPTTQKVSRAMPKTPVTKGSVPETGVSLSPKLAQTLKKLPPDQKQELLALVNQAAAQKAKAMVGGTAPA